MECKPAGIYDGLHVAFMVKQDPFCYLYMEKTIANKTKIIELVKLGFKHVQQECVG